MAEFDEVRAQLGRVRLELDANERQIVDARERLRQAAAEEARFQREFNPGDRAHLRRREQLRQQKARAEAALKSHQASRGRIRDQYGAALDAFAVFSDPRENVTRLNDNFPFLLLPVRLETRFKQIAVAGAVRHQLWVRIFPDQCWVDTFEPTLSESELESARLYWQNVWRAGGLEAEERAAWRGLVGAAGSGRALWIRDNYQPLNLADKPAKASADDLILVIPTKAPLAAGEAAALAEFWRALWTAGDNQERRQDALDALAEAVGQQRAGELRESHQPFNFNHRPPAGAARDEIDTSAAYVVFAAGTSVTAQSWTHAPKVNIFPDRFVFIGYSGADVVQLVGRPVQLPLVVGPAPGAPPEEQVRPLDDGNLSVPEQLQWMVDFDRAVAAGLGFRVDLTPAQAAAGFRRILVLGVRMSAAAEDGQTLLETLLAHHRDGRSGCALIPQGTPTNNTEAEGSGYSWLDDSDESFDAFLKTGGPLFTVTQNDRLKADGQWFAELLGIDPALLQKVQHSGGRDQLEARAMNVALWRATFGYWMDTMMRPVFSDIAVERTRWFFTSFVSGRGPVPAIRIANQPYGVLATTAFSRIGWLRDFSKAPRGTEMAFVARLFALLREIDKDWTAFAQQVSFVGSSADAHKTLLDILGLHPDSVEFHSRYAQRKDHLFNRLNLLGLGAEFNRVFSDEVLRQSGILLLRRLGYTGEQLPDMLDKVFHGAHYKLDEVAGDPSTYMRWLIDAARESVDKVQLQSGFPGNQRPRALLYLMLRHALLEEFHDTVYVLLRDRGVIAGDALTTMKRESAFVHVAASAAQSESRLAPLYRTEARITGNPNMLVADFLPAAIGNLQIAPHLTEHIAALELLEKSGAAALERAFAEHIDCATYRFDAWLLGIVNFQLSQMRFLRDGDEVFTRRGIYLGGYGWLEDVKPENKVFTPVSLQDPELQKAFGEGPPPMLDSTNGGFIHAPSMNHAIAATVLRNGYLSNASPQNRKTLSVNISSERMRLALAMLEGMRNGQSLAALLGYRLEKNLHERDIVGMDAYIYQLRKGFPLVANRMKISRTPESEDAAAEVVAARNVVNGLTLLKHRQEAKPLPTPGKGNPTVILNIVSEEIDALTDIHDAVADLGLAEGVFQAVQGNYDRVAATLETFTKGNFPPEPEILQTPANGITLTHRVALHLEPGVAIPAVNPTPRSTAEPAVNKWLAGVLPPLNQIACRVTWSHPVTGASAGRVVTMDDLRIQPLDLLYLVPSDNQQQMAELDDRVLQFVIDTDAPRPDAQLFIRYLEADPGRFPVFEVAPLVRALRSLVLQARPLRASDAALFNEASNRQDQDIFAERARVQTVLGAADDLEEDMQTFLDGLEPLLADPVANRAALVNGADATIAAAVPLLSRASRFGLPQTGWGFLIDWRRTQFATMLKRVRDLVERWNARLAEFDGLIAAYAALPPGTPEEDKFAHLHKAEVLISTAFEPLPPLADNLLPALNAKRAGFDNRRGDFEALPGTADNSLVNLLGAIQALLPISEFDNQPFETADFADAYVRIATDAANVVKTVRADLDKRRAAAFEQIALHDATGSAAGRVAALEAAAKALLGDEFRIVPEFALGPAQAAEWQNAFTASASGQIFTHAVNTGIDFPVDHWLYGVARVREPMHAWEQVAMLAPAFGAAEPALTPVQFPYADGDSWVALEFPEAVRPSSDRLLYTAHYGVLFNSAARQCGLLLDEWAEVIPSEDREPAVGFHYDRPNTEPPQTMLLVTPAQWDGRWQWDDLVGALNETLDLARKRAVEPGHLDPTAYSRFLPATIMAATVSAVTISTALAANRGVLEALEGTR